MERTLQRAKQNAKGNTGVAQVKTKYSSIKAFYDHAVLYPELLEMKSQESTDSLSAHLVTSSSQSHHLILYDEKLVQQFDQNNDVFIDATFKICPDIKGVTQMLNVMCKKYNTVR